MLKGIAVLLVALSTVSATLLPAQASPNIESQTHQLLNSKGQPIAQEVKTTSQKQPVSPKKQIVSDKVKQVPATKNHATPHHRVSSSGKYAYMVQTIHQASRKPETHR